MNKEIYIYTNGCLLSRRYITSESGTALARTDVSSIALKVYKLTLDTSTGEYTRTLLQTSSLTINDVIPETPSTDADGKLYNFRYCIEGLFTLSNTRYLAEYDITTTDNHHIIFNAKGRTME